MVRYQSILRLFLLIALALIAISHAEEGEAAAVDVNDAAAEAAADATAAAAEAASEAAQKVADAVDEAVDTAAEEAAAAAAAAQAKAAEVAAAASAKAQEVADAAAAAVDDAAEEASGIIAKAKDAVTSSGDKAVAFVKDFKLSKDNGKKIAAGVVGVWGVATAGGWAMDRFGKDKEE
mmetsp:Transcript_13389/g.38224  ORF Transcript_13389/g.38224 Transcript_13389/m.38224 type:complete len:178 (-) Transcript_13389:524-1057(-)